MQIEPLPPPSPSLEREVHRRLRDLIVSGDLVPGALYSMNELAAQLHVSRTPVAQAVGRLVDQGMVRVEHRRGLRVLETSTHDLAEIYELRLLLEPRATYRATGLMRKGDHRRLKEALVALSGAAAAAGNPREFVRRDSDFHRVIMNASGNRRLADFVASLRDLQLIRAASTVNRSRSRTDVVADHQRIYDAIVSGDAVAAARQMHQHILTTGELLIRQETGEPAAVLSGPWPASAGTDTSAPA
ncbi:MAG: GntR family transcriptional regulator [Solirubrobacteraceae bacterium]